MIPAPFIRLGRQLVHAMRGHLVYALVRDGHALYVGKGSSVCRPFDPGHHVISRVYVPGDHIWLWPFDTTRDAYGFEGLLIRSLGPRWNDAVGHRRPFAPPSRRHRLADHELLDHFQRAAADLRHALATYREMHQRLSNTGVRGRLTLLRKASVRASVAAMTGVVADAAQALALDEE